MLNTIKNNKSINITENKSIINYLFVCINIKDILVHMSYGSVANFNYLSLVW